MTHVDACGHEPLCLLLELIIALDSAESSLKHAWRCLFRSLLTPRLVAITSPNIGQPSRRVYLELEVIVVDGEYSNAKRPVNERPCCQRLGATGLCARARAGGKRLKSGIASPDPRLLPRHAAV